MTKRQCPWCIAHRGARDEAPENTKSAFDKALAYPIDGIELDVQMSFDGVPVIYHDHTLRRIGGGHRRISALTFSQLESMNWGGWFHPNYDNEPLMTLEQLLPLLNRCPRMFIEIKSHPREQASGHIARLTHQAIGIITQPQYRIYQDRIYILSFDSQVLALAHRLAPHLPKVLNATGNEPDIMRCETSHLWAIDAQIGHLSPSLVHWARSRNLHVMTYTCNGPRQVAKAVRLGVDAIISDRPGWLTEYLGRE